MNHGLCYYFYITMNEPLNPETEACTVCREDGGTLVTVLVLGGTNDHS